MCGRYSLSTGHEALARAFLAEFAQELQAGWKPRYNICPGTGIVAVIEDRDKGGRRAEVLHWGLVPSWAKSADIGYKLINARAETIGEKPAYRDAFRYRRCLIPASGFYEWDRSRNPRQPYFFNPASGPFFAMAGVWEHWLHPSGSEILSVSLLTTQANSVVGKIHDRMPVMVEAADWDQWLDTSNVRAEGLQSLLHPSADKALQGHPVGTRVNKTDVDDPSLVDAVVPGNPGQLELF